MLYLMVAKSCHWLAFIDMKYFFLSQIIFLRWPIKNGSLNGSTGKSLKK